MWCKSQSRAVAGGKALGLTWAIVPTPGQGVAGHQTKQAASFSQWSQDLGQPVPWAALAPLTLFGIC